MIRITQAVGHFCDLPGCESEVWREAQVPIGGPYHDPVKPGGWVTLGDRVFCCDAHCRRYVAELPTSVRQYLVPER